MGELEKWMKQSAMTASDFLNQCVFTGDKGLLLSIISKLEKRVDQLEEENKKLKSQ